MDTRRCDDNFVADTGYNVDDDRRHKCIQVDTTCIQAKCIRIRCKRGIIRVSFVRLHDLTTVADELLMLSRGTLHSYQLYQHEADNNDGFFAEGQLIMQLLLSGLTTRFTSLTVYDLILKS